jgi:hypothetical protein
MTTDESMGQRMHLPLRFSNLEIQSTGTLQILHVAGCS